MGARGNVGHAKGAFTGSATAHAGLFEEANRGTLFLDEIGDLPLPLQVKLNRALQDREVRRVGEAQARPVDVRVIAATLRDLKLEVAAGDYLEALMKEFEGNVTRAAQRAGVERESLHRLLKRHGLKSEDFK